jgi:hypothetical protein
LVDDAATSISGIRLSGQPFVGKPASENATGTRYPEFDLPFNFFCAANIALSTLKEIHVERFAQFSHAFL